MNKDKYKVINKFKCCGKDMVIVKLHDNVHVMQVEEWKRIYGINHPERWNKKNKHLSKLNNKKLVS